MMLFIIAHINVLWLHFMFSLQSYICLWNVLIGRSLCCCSGKGRFGGSKSRYFSRSIHRVQRSGEKSSVIETVAPMIVTGSPPREYSRSSYLSSSISISPSCVVSLHFICAYQSIALFLCLIPLSIYCYCPLTTSHSPGTRLRGNGKMQPQKIKSKYRRLQWYKGIASFSISAILYKQDYIVMIPWYAK